MKDIVIALLIRDAIGFALPFAVLLLTVCGIVLRDKLTAIKARRRRAAMMELKESLKRVTG